MTIVDWTKAIGTTPEQAADRLYASRPEWVTGYVSHFDARYLLIRTLAARTDVVVEIGTASGVSTAILCHALDLARRAGTIDDGFEVRTYDALEHFYADETKEIGEAARAMLDADLMGHIVFRNPATAATVVEDLEPETLALAFIDADHRHPWPALDLLTLLPCLRPGAEVLLHDINMPARHPQSAQWGASHLFEGVDVEKQAYEADAIPNIGSIWIPDDKDHLRQQLVDLVDEHEWETAVPDRITEPLLG